MEAIPTEMTANDRQQGERQANLYIQRQFVTVTVRWTIFALNALVYSMDFYASWRQYRLYKRHKERPAEIIKLVTADRYAKHRRHKCVFLLFDMLFVIPCSISVCTIFLFSNLIFGLWNLSANFIDGKGLGLSITNEMLLYPILFCILMECCFIPVKYIVHVFNHAVLPRYCPTQEQLNQQKVAELYTDEPYCFQLEKKPSLLRATLTYLKQEFIIIICIPPVFIAVFCLFMAIGPSWPLLIFCVDQLLRSKCLTAKRELTLHDCALKRDLEQMCREEGIKLDGKIAITEEAYDVKLDGGWISGWFSRTKLLLDKALLSDQLLNEIYAHNGVERRERLTDLNFGKRKEERNKNMMKKKEKKKLSESNGIVKGEDVKLMMTMKNEEEVKIILLDEMKKEGKGRLEEADEKTKKNKEVEFDMEGKRKESGKDEEDGIQVNLGDGNEEKKQFSKNGAHFLLKKRMRKRKGRKLAPRRYLLIEHNRKDYYDYDESFKPLNDEELLGLLAAQIGVFKETYTLRYWMMSKIGFLGQFATLFCLFHFTWHQPWLFTVLHFPAKEDPLPLGVIFSVVLLLYPVHKLQNGLVEAAKFWRQTHVEVASAIRLGRARQFQAALLKIAWECDYGLGDWLYCLLNPSERPECPALLKLLAKHLEKDDETLEEKHKEMIAEKVLTTIEKVNE